MSHGSREIIRERYQSIARRKHEKEKVEANKKSKRIGYSDSDLKVAPFSNIGLGCGNPISIGPINLGEKILDLGCGTGFDVFIAAEKVGKDGKVVGVDFSSEMIVRAERHAEEQGVKNVEFIVGDIEDLPQEDALFDVVISNGAINLVPEKDLAFREAHRVLKDGGRMYVSDMVVFVSDNVSRDHKNLDGPFYGGSVPKDDYLKLIREAGFTIDQVSGGPENTEEGGVEIGCLDVAAHKSSMNRNGK